MHSSFQLRFLFRAPKNCWTKRKKHVFSLSFLKHTQKVGAEINVIVLSASTHELHLSVEHSRKIKMKFYMQQDEKLFEADEWKFLMTFLRINYKNGVSLGFFVAGVVWSLPTSIPFIAVLLRFFPVSAEINLNKSFLACFNTCTCLVRYALKLSCLN